MCGHCCPNEDPWHARQFLSKRYDQPYHRLNQWAQIVRLTWLFLGDSAALQVVCVRDRIGAVSWVALIVSIYTKVGIRS